MLGSSVLTPVPLNRFELFMAQYLEHRLTKQVAPFQRQIAAVLDDASATNVILETTRGGGKTTWGEGFALWQIVDAARPGDDIQVVSRSGKDSTSTASKIMRHVTKELEENITLWDAYKFRRGKPWSNNHINVIRADGTEINFYSIGKKSSARGSRGTILVDDPQNLADCRSETVLNGDREWFLADLLPIILPEQRLLFIGTPISPLSLLSTLKEMTEDFTVLSFPIEDPRTGKSVWPEMYPDEFLAQRKRIMGPDLYAGEYLCDPRVSGNPVFRVEWLRHYEPDTAMFRKIKAEGMYIVTAMDCAESKADSADYTAIVTLALSLGPKPDVYVLDVQRGHWSTKEGAERLFAVLNEFHQHKSLVESRVKDNAAHTGGDAMIAEIRDREQIYGQHTNLYPVRPVRDKVSRALWVQSIVQDGRVHVNKHDPNHQILIQELKMFTGDGTWHDDVLDAFVYALGDVKQRGQTGVATVARSALEGSW